MRFAVMGGRWMMCELKALKAGNNLASRATTVALFFH
jgi:hypothetical protein